MAEMMKLPSVMRVISQQMDWIRMPRENTTSSYAARKGGVCLSIIPRDDDDDACQNEPSGEPVIFIVIYDSL